MPVGEGATKSAQIQGAGANAGANGLTRENARGAQPWSGEAHQNSFAGQRARAAGHRSGGSTPAESLRVLAGLSGFHLSQLRMITPDRFDCRTTNDPARWIPLPKCRMIRHNSPMASLLLGDCEGSGRIRTQNWAFLLKDIYSHRQH
jgi:hypothetical protein